MQAQVAVSIVLVTRLVDAHEQVAGLDVAVQDGRRAAVQVLHTARDGADDEQQLGGVPALGRRVVQHHLHRAAREELLQQRGASNDDPDLLASPQS